MKPNRIEWVGSFKGRPAWRIDAAPHIMVLVRRVFAQVQGERGGAAIAQATLEVARDLDWLTLRHDFKMSERDRRYLTEQANEHKAREETVTAILGGGSLSYDGFNVPAREPRRYQLEAADIALINRGLLLADDLGLGKSFSALLTLRDPQAFPALIVTLTHLPDQWVEELEESFPYLTAHKLRKASPYDITARREHKGYMPHVLISNYAKLAGWGETLAGQVKTVIFDECQELRIPGSQKYVAAATIADRADVVMGLSATPVYNYGPEIHAVIDAIAKDSLGAVEEFNREWTSVNESGKRVVTDPRSLGSHLRAEGLMLRRTRADVKMELPIEPLRIPHTIGSDERVIDDEVDRVLALAEMVAYKTGSHQEVFEAAGQLDVRLRRATGVAKAPYVCDFVRMTLEAEADLPDGRASKLVLWGWHHDVYDIYDEKLRDLDPIFYTGKQSTPAKLAAKKAFVDGDARVLIMSLRAGAGLNGLQKVCRVGVFGELDWSPGFHDQCIGRLARDDSLAHQQGIEAGVLAYFLVSRTGSDPIVADVLNIKRSQSEGIRDPDADLFVPAPDTSGHVKRLAESIVAERRRRQSQ